MKHLFQQLFWVVCIVVLARGPASNASAAEGAFTIPGLIIDADTGTPLPARLYVRSEAGKWYFAQAAQPPGRALRYEKKNAANTNAVEMYTTLSPHAFQLELPAGKYRAIAEHGKEYLPLTNDFVVAEGMLTLLRMPLQRWVDMRKRGWYSGDTHVHRVVEELDNVMLAEDVNVVHPMTHWTTVSTVAPADSPQNMKAKIGVDPVRVDPLHYWHPRNTEYEIFRVGPKTHQVGAMVILNHKTPFKMPVFPLANVVQHARSQGALIDLEKHVWPWSFALVPVVGIDLFELSNNHVWQSDYAVRGFGVPAPPWMKLAGRGSENERDWLEYGWKTYYALLNCGFRIRPTASTGHGVHPVAMGYSRVYVHLPEGFSYPAWMKGLNAGRSFVTTGPMLLTTINGEAAGQVFTATGKKRYQIKGEALSERPLSAIEMVVNGEVVRTIKPANEKGQRDTFRTVIKEDLELESSAWIILRCFEGMPGDRFRFAHTAPWHLEVAGKPLRPKREEVAWFVKRVEDEVTRNTGVIPDEGLAEFKSALEAWKKIEARAQ